MGGLLHDIGKIRVHDNILHKPGALDPPEWKEMQKHVLYGVEVLEENEDVSAIALEVCAQHHEKLNGKGYPFQLKSDEITIYGKMAAVVDVFDAVTAHRCYKNGHAPTSGNEKAGRVEWRSFG